MAFWRFCLGIGIGGAHPLPLPWGCLPLPQLQVAHAPCTDNDLFVSHPGHLPGIPHLPLLKTAGGAVSGATPALLLPSLR